MSVLLNKVIEPETIDKFKDIQEELDKPAEIQKQDSGSEELATIKKAGEKEFLTLDQIRERAKELKKIKKDILYFCRKYFKIVSLKDGLVTLDPYPKQAELLKFIQDNNRAIVCASRQVGKCSCKDTVITIRNKTTGEEENITLGEFFDRISYNCNSAIDNETSQVG